jgi:hypothetical protein
MTRRFAATAALALALAAGELAAVEISSITGPSSAAAGAPVTFRLGGTPGGGACNVRVSFAPQGGGAAVTTDVGFGANVPLPHDVVHTFSAPGTYAVRVAGEAAGAARLPACAGRASAEIRIVATANGAAPNVVVGAAALVVPTATPVPCPPGQFRSPTGACAPPKTPQPCAPGLFATPNGDCAAPPNGPCDPARFAAGDPACKAPLVCPACYTLVTNADGIFCKAPARPQPAPCPQGMKWFEDASGFGCRR